MSKTSIEWTEQTWNPIVGCSIVSPGCTNCYAMKMSSRIEAMGNQPRYAGTTRKVNGSAVWTGKLALAPEATMLAPLKRHVPTTYFVNSMGDLFHEDCPDEWIDRVFAVMALCPQHTFQVLTKRAGRMRDYLTRRVDWNSLLGAGSTAIATGNRIDVARAIGLRHRIAISLTWPLSNVWLGVSTERQQEANERIPVLLQTPAAVRFISAEPLLGPIDLSMIPAPRDPGDPSAEWFFDALSKGDVYHQRLSDSFGVTWFNSADGPYRETTLDWVIVGGESGNGARPMHPDWARGLRDQCRASGVPFFFKQWGEYKDGSDFAADAIAVLDDGRCCDGSKDSLERLDRSDPVMRHNPTMMRRVGKKAAGSALDGVEHKALPMVSV